MGKRKRDRIGEREARAQADVCPFCDRAGFHAPTCVVRTLGGGC